VKILDLTAGRRAVWFNKNHPLATYVDRRAEVVPTHVADSTNLPPQVGKDFDLVIFDPPHLNCGPNSNMSRVYGYHTTKQILDLVAGVNREAHRVTKPRALMAMKWNTHDIRLQRVFDLMPLWEPLVGHLTKDGPSSQTYWVLLLRLEDPFS
jgi:23S rRNA G2069 N7-methylase RlmK/C1962 C5-methylase RlmI